MKLIWRNLTLHLAVFLSEEAKVSSFLDSTKSEYAQIAFERLLHVQSRWGSLDDAEKVEREEIASERLLPDAFHLFGNELVESEKERSRASVCCSGGKEKRAKRVSTLEKRDRA